MPTFVILRLPEVQMRVGLSRSSIYAKLSAASKQYDPQFPHPISLGAATSGRRSAVGWLEHEVHAWLQQRGAQRDVDHAAKIGSATPFVSLNTTGKETSK